MVGEDEEALKHCENMDGGYTLEHSGKRTGGDPPGKGGAETHSLSLALRGSGLRVRLRNTVGWNTILKKKERRSRWWKRPGGEESPRRANLLACSYEKELTKSESSTLHCTKKKRLRRERRPQSRKCLLGATAACKPFEG